jgi:pimeloyl-ACP methyl ester carboxylesterase
LLIHGWLGSRDLWAGLIPELSGLGPLVVPDLRGFGETGGEPGDSLQSHVDDLIALLDQLGVEKISVIGHSMGGAIAQSLAAQAPQRVDKLALLASVPASGFPLPPEAYAQFDSIAGNREALQQFFGPQFAHPEAATRFADMAMKASVSAASSSLSAWTGANFAEKLSDLVAPTLVLAGGKDPFLTAEILDRAIVSRIVGAKLMTVDSGGHYLQVDDPQAVGELLRDHLA